MDYLRTRSTNTDPVSPALVQRLALLLGVAVPPADLEELAAGLSAQLVSIEALDRLDLERVPSALDFDPRWR